MSFKNLLLCLVLGSLWLSTAQALMCKWTDEDGTVHYAEECPETEAAETIAIDTTPAGTGDDPYAASRAARNNPGRSTSGSSKNTARRSGGSGLGCEAARERLLKPERERLVAQCQQAGEKSDAQCERFYASHGDGGRQGGRQVPRKYDNIPECVAEREGGS